LNLKKIDKKNLIKIIGENGW